METLQSIGEAIKLIDAKKEGLKKAYDDLQASFPSVLTSLSLTWSDLDSHFTSLQGSLTQRLQLLESLDSGSQNQQDACGIAGVASEPHIVDPVNSAPARPGYSSAVPVPLEATAELSSQNGPPESCKPPLPSPDRGGSVPAPPDSDWSPIVKAQPEAPSSPSSSHQEQNLPSEIDPPAIASAARVDGGLAHPDPVSSAVQQSSNAPESVAVKPRPELKALCSKVDGGGLLAYIIDHGHERGVIQAELAIEIHNSPDPGKLILDAMGGFYQTKEAKQDKSLPKPKRIKTMRNSCIFLLEALMRVSPPFNDRAKRRAKGLALMWKKRTKKDASNEAQILGFLLLVACFGLTSEFSYEDLAEYFLIVASSPLASELCRWLAMGDGIPDLIEKLISEQKELLAVRFIFDLGMTEKFPPFPILKTHLDGLKELTKSACEDGKSSPQTQREAIDKEIEGLESVIKIVEDRKFESEYPKEELQKRIQQLNNLRVEKKRAAKAQEPQKMQVSGTKRPRANPANPPRKNAAFAPHLGPGSASYGFAGSASVSASSSYRVVPARPYGFPGLAPPQPYLYPPELQGPPLYGNSRLPPDYGGYGMHLQYHPSYYPR